MHEMHEAKAEHDRVKEVKLLREEQHGHIRWYDYDTGLSIPEIKCAHPRCGSIASGIEISPFDPTICWECCEQVTAYIQQACDGEAEEFDNIRGYTRRWLEPPENFDFAAIKHQRQNPPRRREAIMATRAKLAGGELPVG